MYQENQNDKFKKDILTRLANGESLNKISKDKNISSRSLIYDWLNHNHNKFEKDFFDEYNKIIVSSKHQRSKFCNSNPKGSRATSPDDYRIKNARKANKKRFPHSSIYIIKLSIFNYYKTEVSNKPQRRFESIEAAMPFDVEMIFNQQINNTYDLEELIHNQFKSKYIISEWFILTQTDISNILKTIKQWHGTGNTQKTK